MKAANGKEERDTGFEVIGADNDIPLTRKTVTSLEKIKFSTLLKDTLKEMKELEAKCKSILKYFEIYQTKLQVLEKFKKDLINTELTLQEIYEQTWIIKGHNICKCYLYTISALFYFKDNEDPKEITNFLENIMIALGDIKISVASYFARYFAYTNILEKLQKHVSLENFLNWISNLTDVYRKMRVETKNSPEVKTVEFVLQILLNILYTNDSYTKAQGDILNKTIETIFQCIYDEKTNIFLDFILDWFSKGLSEEKAINSISTILDGLSKLTQYDQKIGQRLFNILERILTYYRSLNDEQKKAQQRVISTNFKENIYNKLIIIIKEAKDFKEKDTKKADIKFLFDFIISSLSFIYIYNYQSAQNPKYSNEIFKIMKDFFPNIPKRNDSVTKRSQNPESLNECCIKLRHILTEYKISIFSIPQFIEIIEKKDLENKREWIINTIEYFLELKEEIDKAEKINIIFKSLLMNLIKEREILKRVRSISGNKPKNSISFRLSTASFTADSGGRIDEDEEKEVNLISRCIWASHNKVVDLNIQLIFMIKSILFDNIKDKNYMRNSWRDFISYLQNFVKNLLIISYNNNNKGSNLYKPNAQYDISSFSNKDLLDRISNIYEIIRDLINNDFMYCQKENLENIRGIIANFDQTQDLYNETNKDPLKKICFRFIKLYLKLISVFSETQDEHSDLIETTESQEYIPKPNKLKVKILKEFINTLKDFTFFSRKEYISVIDEIRKTSETFQFRVETIRILIHSCDLYYNNNLKEIDKIKANLQKAREQSEFAVVEIKNLTLYLKIIKKYMYFLKQGEKNIISPEELQKLFDFVYSNRPVFEDYAKSEGGKLLEKMDTLEELHTECQKNHYI